MTKLSKEEKTRMKQERIEAARKHIEYVEKNFDAEIQYSIEHTKIYSSDSFEKDVLPAARYTNTKYIVSGMDSVSAAYIYGKEGKKTAILNFADFTRIGGGYTSGLFAQEEALCSESCLYLVQKAFEKSYYEENAKIKQNLEIKDLYSNRALYSENVVFIHEDVVRSYDVITCASPNYYRGQRYHAIDPEKNDKALRDRIHFILQIARDNSVDVLILGAFGCGVFSQDPYRVAEYFKEFLCEEFAGAFETVAFPIPKPTTKNHKAFAETFYKK